MTRLSVDTRWLEGHHGIARWAREVVPLLPFPWEPLAPDLKKASVPDVLWLGHELRNYDVHFSPGYNAGARVHRRSARQLIVVHDLIYLEVESETSLAKRAYFHGVLRPAIRRSNLVMTDSEFSRTRIAAWSGLAEDRIVVAGAGVATQLLATDETAPTVRDRPYVLFVGAARPHKRLPVAVEAVLDDPEERFDLVIVGSTADAPAAVRAKIAAHPRARVVTGITDAELGGLYRGAQCVLFPSEYEGFGLPALEGMHLGVPVVWSSEAAGEIVGDLGVHVPVAEGADGLRAALAPAAARRDEPGWQQRCAERSARFTWQGAADAVTGALEELSR